MADQDSLGTHDRILSAAEELFAKQGFNGTSLRQITDRARVNLAAVSYHQGGKESLYMEVFRRRLKWVNDRRLTLLAEGEGKSSSVPLPADQVVAIFAGPCFELYAQPGTARFGVRLLGRLLSDPLPFVEPIMASEMQPVLARFAQLLRRHSPASSPEDFLWRFNFVVGALHHTLATLHQMAAQTRGICRDGDHDGALRRFVEFGAGVFAPRPQSPDAS